MTHHTYKNALDGRIDVGVRVWVSCTIGRGAM